MIQYYVETWDTEKQKFTPQKGVRAGPYSLFGLRTPLRALREMGYMARKGDGYVSVYGVKKKRKPKKLKPKASPT